MSHSIFGSQALTRPPGVEGKPQRVWERPAKQLAREAIEARDEALIAIIETPLKEGETAYAGFARKEEELRVAFAALSVIDARTLRLRLCTPRSFDRFAVAFSRLTIERRVRLINFLAGARRREALSQSER